MIYRAHGEKGGPGVNGGQVRCLGDPMGLRFDGSSDEV